MAAAGAAANPGSARGEGVPNPYEHLTGLLGEGHGIYVAAKRIEDDLEALELRDEANAPVDLLLLVAGALRNDPRALQEYLRLHGEALPREVRARMTRDLARKLSEASKRNGSQEPITLAPRLDPRLRADRGEGCTLRANGRDLGPLWNARPRVTPGAPQRLLVRCPDGVRYLTTVVPSADSRTEVAVVVAEGEARLLPGGPSMGDVGGVGGAGGGNMRRGNTVRTGAGVPGEVGSGSVSGAGTPSSAVRVLAGTPRIARSSAGVTLIVVRDRAAGHGLHNLGFDDGLFTLGGLSVTGARWHGGLAYGTGTQREATPSGPGAFGRLHVFAATAGTAWAWMWNEPESPTPKGWGLEIPVQATLWRWVCRTRPCGFHKKDPSISLAAGTALLAPLGSGVYVELAALPAVVMGARPVPHLEFRTQVSRDF